MRGPGSGQGVGASPHTSPSQLRFSASLYRVPHSLSTTVSIGGVNGSADALCGYGYEGALCDRCVGG